MPLAGVFVALLAIKIIANLLPLPSILYSNKGMMYFHTVFIMNGCASTL